MVRLTVVPVITLAWPEAMKAGKRRPPAAQFSAGPVSIPEASGPGSGEGRGG
jgi:hypothetical protein